LVDAGYPNMKGYLSPYKGERYHIPDFRDGSQAQGIRELFKFVMILYFYVWTIS
jgi:hypothetical protein